MHCCSAVKRRLGFWLAICLLALVPVSQADNDDVPVTVRYATFDISGDNLMLDAAFTIRLSNAQVDGLKKGLSLSYVTEFQLQRTQSWWFNVSVIDAARTGRLSYSLLTRRYQLETPERFKAFDTLAEALSELGRYDNWVVGNKSQLISGAHYQAALRIRLGQGPLSIPLQFKPFDFALGKMWGDSDWYKWGYTAP